MFLSWKVLQFNSVQKDLFPVCMSWCGQHFIINNFNVIVECQFIFLGLMIKYNFLTPFTPFQLCKLRLLLYSFSYHVSIMFPRDTYNLITITIDNCNYFQWLIQEF